MEAHGRLQPPADHPVGAGHQGARGSRVQPHAQGAGRPGHHQVDRGLCRRALQLQEHAGRRGRRAGRHRLGGHALGAGEDAARERVLLRPVRDRQRASPDADPGGDAPDDPGAERGLAEEQRGLSRRTGGRFLPHRLQDPADLGRAAEGQEGAGAGAGRELAQGHRGDARRCRAADLLQQPQDRRGRRGDHHHDGDAALQAARGGALHRQGRPRRADLRRARDEPRHLEEPAAPHENDVPLPRTRILPEADGHRRRQGSRVPRDHGEAGRQDLGVPGGRADQVGEPAARSRGRLGRAQPGQGPAREEGSRRLHGRRAQAGRQARAELGQEK